MARNSKVKQTWVLFIVTFLVTLIVVTYTIKSFSPNVDVEIGGEEEQLADANSSDSDVKQAIDDRLRWIQMEDNMPGASRRDENQDENYSNEENDEVVKKAKKDKDKADKAKQVLEEAPEEIEYVSQKPAVNIPPVPAQPAAEPFKMAKVYVGSYPTIEQAIQAQNNLMNAPISVSPFVKEVNGVYVLQAGSYANASKAEAVAREINSVGFSARVVKE